MDARIVGAWLALLLITPLPASAGVIKGQLWMSAQALKAAVAHRQETQKTPSPDAPAPRWLQRAQSGVRDAVLYIEEVPESVERRLERESVFSGWFSWLPWIEPKRTLKLKRLVQSHQQFDPRVMVSRAGDSIELWNLDDVYHNAFSVSAAKRFDLGKYPPGKRDTVAFDEPGIVNLHCDIHPDEAAYVVVVPNRAYATPDSLGRFELPSIPAGSYRLHFWHPHHGEQRVGVVMPRHGNLTLDLAF